MAHLVTTLGKRICVEESRDPSKRNNGGEYDFYETPVIIDGVEVGRIKTTSAQFDYCKISGWFTSTVSLAVIGLVHPDGDQFYISADRYYGDRNEQITIDKFIRLIQK